MPTLHNEIHIDATPDAVWAVLGDLSSPPEWIPGVVAASVDGTERVCRTADGHEIHEEIVDYSEGDQAWSYEQRQVPLPISGSRGKLRASADDGGSRVEWDASFELLDPDAIDVVPMIDGYYKQTLESLRERVERAKPSGSGVRSPG